MPAEIFYATQAHLEAALSPATVLALYDDGSTGQVNQETLLETLRRARDWVDGYLARVYQGPFPVPQAPVPRNVINAALEFAIAFSFERHPEYVRTYGESYRASTRFKRAQEMGEQLCNGMLEIPDWVLQPKPRNVGGVIYDHSKRIVIDNADGSSNEGDW